MPSAFWRSSFVAVLLLGLAIAAIHPVAEVGMNDDWSFIRTAFDLAASGHLRYNGWAAPFIGFQAYWAALFLRVFGMSFSIARFSTQLLTVLFVPVLVRLFRVAGLLPASALFATLLLVLSPVMLPSLTSFMTDTPAFLLFAGSLLAALECWRSPVRRQASFWLALATVCGALSGSVRQIYWAATVWFLLVLGFSRFKTAAERLAAGGCGLVLLAFALLCSRWQSLQPYVSGGSSTAALHEMPPGEALTAGISYMLHFVVTWCVLLLPVTVAFARIRRTWLLIPVAILAGWLMWKMAQPLPWVGNTLTQNGVLSEGLDVAGLKPVVLSAFAIWLIATVGVLCAFLALQKWIRLPAATLQFAILTLPFLLLYVAVIALRAPVYGVYDRYSIPVLAILAAILLSAYQQHARRLPIPAWIVLGVYAVYGMATTHDSFAGARARQEVTAKLLASGVKRTQILAGFEFDCETQVGVTGYINNDQIKIPANAYREADDCNGDDSLQLWWRSMAPDLKAEYVITLTPLVELEPGIVASVPYETWLPFGTHYAYAQRTKEPLTCRASN